MKRGSMSRKRILNITSRKKQDNMRSWSGTPFLAGSAGPIVMQGDDSYMFGFVCTARDKDLGTGPAPIEMDPSRTATRCYMRGFKERIDLFTGSAHPWIWRRILFTYKGLDLLRVTEEESPGDPGLGQLWVESSDGYGRYYANIGDLTDLKSATIGRHITGLIFKGTEGADYTSNFSAKTDSERVKILYDKTVTIRSGNDRGVIKTYRRWHGFNKTLIYDEDEVGDETANRLLSSQSPRSMGDVYVIDFFSPGLGGTADDELRLLPTGTLYWHER